MQHSGHWLLRIYGTLHLLAVYAALVGGMPGFNHVLQPAQQKPLLTVIGLWHPSVAAGMLPPLGLLLLVRRCFALLSVMAVFAAFERQGTVFVSAPLPD